MATFHIKDGAPIPTDARPGDTIYMQGGEHKPNEVFQKPNKPIIKMENCKVDDGLVAKDGIIEMKNCTIGTSAFGESDKYPSPDDIAAFCKQMKEKLNAHESRRENMERVGLLNQAVGRATRDGFVPVSNYELSKVRRSEIGQMDDIRMVHTEHWVAAGEECPHCKGNKLVDLYWDSSEVGCYSCGREYKAGSFYRMASHMEAPMSWGDENRDMRDRDFRPKSEAEFDYMMKKAEELVKDTKEPAPKVFPHGR